jgi:hypothetical protein
VLPESGKVEKKMRNKKKEENVKKNVEENVKRKKRKIVEEEVIIHLRHHLRHHQIQVRLGEDSEVDLLVVEGHLVIGKLLINGYYNEYEFKIYNR